MNSKFNKKYIKEILLILVAIWLTIFNLFPISEFFRFPEEDFVSRMINSSFAFLYSFIFFVAIVLYIIFWIKKINFREKIINYSMILQWLIIVLYPFNISYYQSFWQLYVLSIMVIIINIYYLYLIHKDNKIPNIKNSFIQIVLILFLWLLPVFLYSL